MGIAANCCQCGSPCVVLAIANLWSWLLQKRKPFNVIGFLKTPYGMMGGAHRCLTVASAVGSRGVRRP